MTEPGQNVGRIQPHQRFVFHQQHSQDIRRITSGTSVSSSDTTGGRPESTWRIFRASCRAYRLRQQLDAGIEPAAMHDRIFRITRGKQHGQIRPQRARPRHHVGAFQRAGHDDIGEKKIDRRIAFDHRKRAHPIAGGQHAVAEIGEHFHHDGAHRIVVLGDENGFGATRRIEPGGLCNRSSSASARGR